MPATSPNEFLSCDWGTSHFRLRWIANGAVVRHFRDDNGCKRLLELSKQNFAGSRAELFQNHLLSVLTHWEGFHPAGADPIPLLISGMASSTIGWVDLPYAKAPLPLDGTELRIEKLAWQKPVWIGGTYLISGVATETNMMRGEETEAIGLLSGDETLPEDALLILPGTHSKHLRICKGVLLEIQTYMTGELYEVLSRATVLSASIDKDAPQDEANFLEGADSARSLGLPASLFLTRTRQVLGGRLPAENASFLSGLLVGAEIHDALRRFPGTSLRIAGTHHLRSLYAAALRATGAAWDCFPEATCDIAVPRGHQVILSKLAA